MDDLETLIKTLTNLNDFRIKCIEEYMSKKSKQFKYILDANNNEN